jgi:hypothetical protein
MVSVAATLRTAYIEHKALTPVAQPKDRARVRFKRLFLAPARRLIVRVGEKPPGRDNLMPLHSLSVHKLREREHLNQEGHASSPP